ncbi:MAG: hypothetical protein JNL72_11130, partial [Flavipsychrobacter sp.]|nr:hypothetical protein [Flavipsychrobacter sp.]
MKKVLLLACAFLGLLATKSSAQWVEITNGQNTTQNYGGVDVTVTAVNPSFNGGCEGTYWIANTGDSYTFTFSQPVSAVQIWCDAINTSEETAFYVNGQLFPLTTCNVTEYINSCSPVLCDIVNGVFVNTNVSLCGGLITVYGSITTVTVLQQFGNSGTTFDVFFPPDSVVPAPAGSVTAASNSPVNCGDTLHLTATASGATSYSWTGPNGFTSTQQNPSLQVNNLGSGQYIVTAMTSCGAISDTVDVVVAPFTYLPPAGSNSPVCQNGILTLTTPQLTNATYSWTGPNSYTSSAQNPVIDPVPLNGAGTYSVVVTVNNCSSLPGTTDVVVDTLPPAPITADITYCLGDTTAVPLTAQGTNLTWYYVPTGGTPIPGGAPTPNTSTAGTITYYVSSTGPGPTNCEGPRSPLNVTIYAHPVLPQIQYKNSYCANEVFEPFVVLSGQNILYYTQAIGGVGDPTPPVLDPTVPGTYQWFATQNVNGCESSRLPITIIVHPFIQASFTYDILWGCAEDSVQFTNTSTGAFGYTWSFGDGQSETTTSPLHVYEDQDVYTVRLISTAPYCRDTVEEVIDLN